MARAQSLLASTALLSGCLAIWDIHPRDDAAAKPPAPSNKCPLASDEPTGPVIFFTDLESGPTSGGEDDQGVFITIYGLRFGTSRGASRVTIGGEEVARYVAWNPPAEIELTERRRARGLEIIVVQPGPLVKSGELVVSVGDRSSNALSFTARDGDIYFVDPSAADPGDGSFDAPFQSLYSARRPTVTSGDTVYVMGGSFDAIDPLGGNSNFYLTPMNAAIGTPSRPVAYVAYPGTQPVIGAGVGTTPSEHAIWLADPTTHEPPSHYVFAGFLFRGTSAGALPITGPGMRIVGNGFVDIAGEGGALPTLSPVSGRIDTKILGNYFYDLNGGAALWISESILGIEFGWNEARDISAFAALNIETTVVDDLSIHDNLLFDLEILGIYLYSGSKPAPQAGIAVFNNAVFPTQSYAALRLGMHGVPEGYPIDISHNTLVGRVPVSLTPSSTGPGSYVLRNNILQAQPAYSYFAPDDTADPTVVSFDHNLYFNGESVPDDPAAATGNPLLADVDDVPPNIARLVDSAATDVGVETEHCADYYGVLRPQGTAYDLGATEFTGTAAR